MLPQFSTFCIERDGVALHGRSKISANGQGAPTDLRGYGDSGRPAAFAPEALTEYERCAKIASSGHSIAEDYRASATIDRDHDRANVQLGRKLHQPLHVLWGEQGAVGQCFDVMAMWRDQACHVTGRTIPCGHYIAEEDPAALLDEAFQFFRS